MTSPNPARGPLVVALLVLGSLLVLRSSDASSDAVQVCGLLAGGLGVGSAALLMRDSVLNR